METTDGLFFEGQNQQNLEDQSLILSKDHDPIPYNVFSI